MRQHGERTRYAHGPDANDVPKSITGVGCRCYDCEEANRAYARHNNRQRLYGLTPWASEQTAAAVRAHLTALRQEGIGLRVVAQRASVSRSTLREVVAGHRMRPQTAQRLLALPLQLPRAEGSLVDATITWQRIDALLAAGYTKVWIAEQIGQSRSLQLRRTQVTVRHARRIRVLHQRFIGLPPPDRSTVNCCARTGSLCTWPPNSPWFCPACGYALHECRERLAAM